MKTSVLSSITRESHPCTAAKKITRWVIIWWFFFESTRLSVFWTMRLHNWFGEAPGGREIGMGREWGGGGQFTSNLGPGWTGLHHTRGGIPSK
jgi:hypothetical protein